MAKQSRPGISGYPNMALTKTAPKEPFSLGPIEERKALRYGHWLLVACVGAFLGMLGLYIADTVHLTEEERLFMGQCVVVKEQSEQRCSELWRYRLNK